MRFLTAFIAACLCASVAVAQPTPKQECFAPTVDFVVGELEPLVGTVFSEMLVYEGDRATKYVDAVSEIYGQRWSRQPTEVVVVLAKGAEGGELFAFRNGCLIGGGTISSEADHKAVVAKAFGTGA